MKRIPVKLTYGWTPPRVIAWVPWPRTIVLNRDVTPTVRTVAHELHHVRQFETRGIFFYLAYVVGFALSQLTGREHWMEKAAREAEDDPDMRAWATRLLAKTEV